MNKGRMWIRLAVLLTLLTAIAGQASADSQWDLTLSVPYYTGVTSDDESLGEFSDYLFLIPDVKWQYYFGPEAIHFGVGFRLFTLVIESALYPIISLESNLGNFVINASVGGGVFLFFGLHNAFESGAVFLPELTVAYKLGKRKIFSLGTGGTFVLASSSSSLGGSAFIGTAFARWTF